MVVFDIEFVFNALRRDFWGFTGNIIICVFCVFAYDDIFRRMKEDKMEKRRLKEAELLG